MRRMASRRLGRAPPRPSGGASGSVGQGARLIQAQELRLFAQRMLHFGQGTRPVLRRRIMDRLQGRKAPLIDARHPRA